MTNYKIPQNCSITTFIFQSPWEPCLKVKSIDTYLVNQMVQTP